MIDGGQLTIESLAMSWTNNYAERISMYWIAGEGGSYVPQGPCRNR